MKDLPALDALLAVARVVAIPTRTRFRGVSVREAVIFDWPGGAAEFSPFPEYADEEAATWLAAAIAFGGAGTGAGTREGDGAAQPPILRDRIAINATVPALSVDAVAGVLQRFPGCRTAKVKVAEPGQALADDVARVRAVRAEMGDEARIRIDANGGWSVEEAAVALRALAPLGLEYVEQPCASVSELAELRDRIGGTSHATRIAADESVRKAADPLAVARAGAADLLVVKAQPLGGVTRALQIVQEAGLPVVVSSALDTSVGIAMGLHLAAALPEGSLAGACGLGTVALLAGDVTRDSLLPVDGEIRVQRPALDHELLDRYAASPERAAWWLERITRCHAILTAA